MEDIPFSRGHIGLTHFLSSKREPAECLGTFGIGKLATSGAHLLFTLETVLGCRHNCTHCNEYYIAQLYNMSLFHFEYYTSDLTSRPLFLQLQATVRNVGIKYLQQVERRMK
jgi:hypothetical protein